jgi:hypothetical protein
MAGVLTVATWPRELVVYVLVVTAPPGAVTLIGLPRPFSRLAKLGNW